MQKTGQKNKRTIRILSIGEILWDMLPSGPREGGAPMNVALHLGRLGIDSLFAGKIGNDDPGKELSTFLQRYGIGTGLLQTDFHLPTGKVKVEIGTNEQITFNIEDNVAWDNIESTTELRMAAKHADAVIFGTLASRHKKSRDTIREILTISDGIKVLDVNLRPPYTDRKIIESLLVEADIAKLNDDELKKIGIWNGLDLPEKELMSWLSMKFDCSIVCVTRGANGAMLYESESKKIIDNKGFKVNVIDTVGSGDAFLSGFIYCHLNKKSLEESLSFACALGSMVATMAGGTPFYEINDIQGIMDLPE